MLIKCVVYPLCMGVMAALDGYLFYRFRKARWL